MSQLALTLDQAREEGKRGMRRAESRAERDAGPDFTKRLAAYFYALLVERGPLSGEDLTDAARAAGLLTGDGRSSGAAFKRLLTIGGEIVPDVSVPRRNGHGSAGGRLYRIGARK